MPTIEVFVDRSAPYVGLMLPLRQELQSNMTLKPTLCQRRRG